MEDAEPMHKDRALLVSLVVLVLAFGAYMLRETGGAGWMPGCFFKSATGFDCPGCGMTRATHASLHGDFGKAFGLNPVGMILLPMAMLFGAVEVAGWVRGKPLPFRLRSGRWTATVVAAVMIVWWVLRNLI